MTFSTVIWYYRKVLIDYFLPLNTVKKTYFKTPYFQNSKTPVNVVNKDTLQIHLPKAYR